LQLLTPIFYPILNYADNKNLLLKKAFEQFHDGMLFYAFQYLGNKEDSEDIVQELYINLWEADSLVFENENKTRGSRNTLR
jgi:DNA-directed RNA polymerase specialized sigma24 family protein